MDTATIVIIIVIVLATLGIWLLPMRKRWNDDGSADEARRQAVARDVVPEASDTEDTLARDARGARQGEEE